MYNIEIKPSCQRDIEKLCKKNPVLKQALEKKMNEIVQKAIKSIKQGSYIHIVKEKVMYVMFRNHMFKFSRGYPELETAREYGKSIGIIEKEMPFEKLINHPFGYNSNKNGK